MSAIAKTPDPPYYAVIFTSVRSFGDDGYAHMAEEMMRLVADVPGFLGCESFRDTAGRGITVSYWDSLASIETWKNNPRHRIARKMGAEKWYDECATRICRVERHGLFKA